MTDAPLENWNEPHPDEEAHFILSNSQALGDAFTPGIYYLIDDSEIVYIGQSLCMMSRITTHFADNKKVFNRFYCDPATLHDLDVLEINEIIQHNPKYNIALPQNDTYASMGKLKARFREPEYKIRAIIKEHNIGHIHVIGRDYYFLQEFNGLLKPVGKGLST